MQKVKDVGGFVVRNVDDQELARKWGLELKVYVAMDEDEIKG
jgi:hypothetical protein